MLLLHEEGFEVGADDEGGGEAGFPPLKCIFNLSSLRDEGFKLGSTAAWKAAARNLPCLTARRQASGCK